MAWIVAGRAADPGGERVLVDLNPRFRCVRFVLAEAKELPFSPLTAFCLASTAFYSTLEHASFCDRGYSLFAIRGRLFGFEKQMFMTASKRSRYLLGTRCGKTTE